MPRHYAANNEGRRKAAFLQEAELTLECDAAAATRATLVDAIECLGDAFVLYDADDRLLLCKRSYLRMCADCQRCENIAGLRFENLVRLWLAKGEVIDPAFEGDASADQRSHATPPLSRRRTVVAPAR